MSVRIIAEAGSNHNGSYTTAQRLIEAAAKCGCDYVKFQHYPDKRYGPHPMTTHWLEGLNDWADLHSVGFMCSVFDLRTLEEYVDAVPDSPVKIASPELTDDALLKAAAQTGREIILSTGMSTEAQIAHAYVLLLHSPLTLLHCTSSYPAPPEEVNIRAMGESLLHEHEYGLSDHTLDPTTAPVAAVALGATTIEKHFTLSRTQNGPDHSYALNPLELADMVRAVRLCEQMLGDGVKRVMPSEDPTARRTAEWRAEQISDDLADKLKDWR